MTRVVSVTPIELERDSRTLKQAASLARLGYESVVVEEGESVALPRELPFRLIGTAPSGDDQPAAVPTPAAAPVAGGRLRGRLGSAFGAARAKLTPTSGRLKASRRFLADYREFNRRTLAALPDAELYWLHSYWQFPAVRRKCRRTGARFVYDAHDSYRDIPAIDLPLVPSLLALIERRCVARAAARTTVSAGVARRLRGRYGREFTVIRNFPDLRLDRPATTTIRDALNLGDEDFLVVMVGQWKFGLALEEAIAALGELEASVHLAFVGPGFEREGSSLAAGRSRVHFVAPVDPTRISGFIGSADAAALLYMPLTENMVNALPNGFFHAVAAGLPLLYPPLAEVRELAERHRLGLEIDPAEPSSIAEGIRALLTDRPRLRTIAEDVARARVELSWEREEPVLVELVRRALAGGGGWPGPVRGGAPAR